MTNTQKSQNDLIKLRLKWIDQELNRKRKIESTKTRKENNLKRGNNERL